jgi:hypothetical protein
MKYGTPLTSHTEFLLVGLLVIIELPWAKVKDPLGFFQELVLL